MTRYANLNRDSAVLSYEITEDSITVEFDSRSVYLYTYISAGVANIEQMKSLAIAGKGLCSFIGRVVKKQYAAKLR
jgi:hypothetical protein